MEFTDETRPARASKGGRPAAPNPFADIVASLASAIDPVTRESAVKGVRLPEAPDSAEVRAAVRRLREAGASLPVPVTVSTVVESDESGSKIVFWCRPKIVRNATPSSSSAE